MAKTQAEATETLTEVPKSVGNRQKRTRQGSQAPLII